MTPSTNGTGVQYPHITLGGVDYELKFTREVLYYRLSKAGLDLGNLGDRLKNLAAVCDIVHALIGRSFSGTAEDVAQMILAEDKIRECATAIAEALGKVLPPAQPTQVTATEEASIQ